MTMNRPEPKQSLTESSPGRHVLWRDDSAWAQNLVATLPGDIASSLYKQYVARWEKYVTKNGQSRSANIWLRRQVEMLTSVIAQFPVHISKLRDEVKRTQLAKDLAGQCHNVIASGAETGKTMQETYREVMDIPKRWRFSVAVPMQTIAAVEGESLHEYEDRVKEILIAGQFVRLITEEWWANKLDIAYRRFCEYCRIIAGKVRKGVSAYLSRIGLREYKERKLASRRALAQMIAKNELTGEEIALIEAVDASVSNPEIRRHELMVRMRGFEDIAEEHGLMGGFFTVTAPSKYHAFIKDKQGKTHSNRKYQGACPRKTNRYLGYVWSKARAKLNRMGIQIIGFRVVEPHHDGTPHWHMLFFFKPEHEQLIRFVFANYFTQEDREELRVSDFDMGYWASSFEEDGSFAPMADLNLIEQTAKRISPRFDYQPIDPEKGSATGYIAKYISKNIDGFKVDEDDEAETAANITAEAVTGWASTWGIRQFQQIGGPPVSVWRELRRMEQDEETKTGIAAAKVAGEKYQRPVKSFLELKAEKPQIEVARIAADSGSWSMFIQAMGGLFCLRRNQPLRLVYKPQENQYGEAVKKLKGITNQRDLTLISRADGWVIAKKGSATTKSGDSRAPWSSVNNCTQSDPVPQKGTLEDAVSRIVDISALGDVVPAGIEGRTFDVLLSGGNVAVGDGRSIKLRGGELDENGNRRPMRLIEFEHEPVDLNWLDFKGWPEDMETGELAEICTTYEQPQLSPIPELVWDDDGYPII
ncbi:replication endonuclease [Photobacterium sp. 53610]|uniref:replication endonuclease n=1 Tax=Photobacterium sp. 53610 TaxID=3102789 RepID=UPI002ED9F285